MPERTPGRKHGSDIVRGGMGPTDATFLAAMFFVVAALYSSVGHGGASGYLAAMALAGTATVLLRPISLSLNILVAGLATIAFARAGFFSWRLFLPFALAAVPAAALGGAIALPPQALRVAIGVLLLISALRLVRPVDRTERRGCVAPRRSTPLVVGAAIGLVAGLTGTGGGILLSPLLLHLRWADVKRTAATSAAFVLVNSLAGLVGLATTTDSLPEDLRRWWWLWAGAAVAGGALGSHLGATRMAPPHLRRILAIVLVIAGCKMALA